MAVSTVSNLNVGRRDWMQTPLDADAASVVRAAGPDCGPKRREIMRMASNAPARDYLLPRLTALVNDAVAAGIAREVAVAVLIDLVTSPDFDTAAPDPKADSEPHTLWNRGPDSVVLVSGHASPPLPVDARDEADFIKPFGGMEPS
jgi:hypothetical protein